MPLLSQVGLLILAHEVLSCRRMWVALLGLLICDGSRQLTGVYAVALLFAAWWGEGGGTGNMHHEKPRSRRMATAVLGLAVIVAVPMGLNWAKLGSPFRTGYDLI